jgi:type II secretory pathway component PulJ
LIEGTFDARAGVHSTAVPALETLIAAVGGALLGVGIASLIAMQRDRRHVRERAQLEAKLRREIVPVLERRADHLGIPPAARGSNDTNAVELAIALARAIRLHEESVDLPYGDTLEVSRRELNARISANGEKT